MTSKKTKKHSISKSKRLLILMPLGSLLAIGTTTTAIVLPLTYSAQAYVATDLTTFLTGFLDAGEFPSTPDQFAVLERIRQNMIDAGKTGNAVLSINDVESNGTFDPTGSWSIKAKAYSVQYSGTASLTWTVKARKQISVDLNVDTIPDTTATRFLAKPTTVQILRALKSNFPASSPTGNGDMQLNQLDCTAVTDISVTNNISYAECFVIPRINSPVYAPNINNSDEVEVFFYYWSGPINLDTLITDTSYAFQDIPTIEDLWGEIFRDNPNLVAAGLTTDDLIFTPDFTSDTGTIVAVDSSKYPGTVNIDWTVNVKTKLDTIFTNRDLDLFIEVPPVASDIWLYARNQNPQSSFSENDWEVLHDSVNITVTPDLNPEIGTATMTAVNSSTRYEGTVTFNWELDKRVNIAEIITSRNLGNVNFGGQPTPSASQLINLINSFNPTVTIDWTQLTIENITDVGADVQVIANSKVYMGGDVPIVYNEVTGAADGHDWAGATGVLTNYTVDQVNHTIAYHELASGSTFTANNLVIPDVVYIGTESYKVITIGTNAFGTNISGSITIGSNVVTIEDNAFEDCVGLTSIIIPTANALTSIGAEAFLNTGLVSTIVGDNHKISCDTDNVYYITSDSKYYCLGSADAVGETNTAPAGTIAIKADTKVIAAQAFANTTITSVTTPNTLVAIDEEAFFGCTSLASISLANSITTIGQSAFRGCTGLIGTLTLPTSLTCINKYTFNGCTGLTGIVIPDTVAEFGIGELAFAGCTNLVSALSDADNMISADASDVYYIRNNSSYFCLGKAFNVDGTATQPIGPITLKNNTKVIANSAFESCQGITGSLTIPTSVVSINALAFSGCDGISGNLVIPSSVTYLGTGAFDHFAYTSASSSLTINASITTLDAVFTNTKFSSVTLPSSLTAIGAQAFYGCADLTSLAIPAYVNSIGAQAFAGCSSLISATETNNMITPDANNVYYLKTGSNYYCLGKGANLGVTITNPTGPLTLNNATRVIADEAFKDCTTLTGDLNIPTSVMAIGAQTFANCSGLTGDLVIAKTTTLIGEDAFNGAGLSEIHIDYAWKNWAFQNWWASGIPSGNLSLFGCEFASGDIYINGNPF